MISLIQEDESYNNIWIEKDLWYGYSYNDHTKKFVFDDTGHESLVDLLNSIWKDGE